MLEIVFSDSACGSLKVAQRFGKGAYSEDGIGVVIGRDDGGKPTQKQISEARRRLEKERRAAWERATPFEGGTNDIFGLHSALSVGDIAKEGFVDNRRKTLERLFSAYPQQGQQAALELTNQVSASLREVQERASAGESVRVWYSNSPDELCGLYWLCSQMHDWNALQGEVRLIQLPPWEITEKGTLVQKVCFGEVAPEEWNGYLPLEKTAPLAFKRSCALRWNELQQENAPLRAFINGRLMSVSEDFYDGLIMREIEQEKEEFQQAMVVGRVLGKYQLGIGDGWVALRIEEMIKRGDLERIEPSPEGAPIYHQKLRSKCLRGVYRGGHLLR